VLIPRSGAHHPWLRVALVLLASAACANRPRSELSYEEMALYELSTEIALLRMEADNPGKLRHACAVYRVKAGRAHGSCPGDDAPPPPTAELPVHVSHDGSIAPCPARDYARRGSRPDWAVLGADVKTARAHGDTALTLRILCSAAAWEIAEAELGLCLISLEGASVQQDVSSAEHWCRLAKRHGEPRADEMLAGVLLRFQPSPVLGAEIEQLLLAAANRKSPDAALSLAGLYAMGEHLPRDLEAARRWATVAQELGHPDAAELIRLIDGYRAGGGS
jgi:hypothetical protein